VLTVCLKRLSRRQRNYSKGSGQEVWHVGAA
jgi:hypothetical protein